RPGVHTMGRFDDRKVTGRLGARPPRATVVPLRRHATVIAAASGCHLAVVQWRPQRDSSRIDSTDSMHAILKTSIAALGLSAALAASSAYAKDATGAGASFVYPDISRWSVDYQQATGK